MVLKSVWLEMRWQNFWWNQIFFHPAGLSIRRKWVRHGSPMLTEESVDLHRLRGDKWQPDQCEVISIENMQYLGSLLSEMTAGNFSSTMSGTLHR